jgi:hypothetical protein
MEDSTVHTQPACAQLIDIIYVTQDIITAKISPGIDTFLPLAIPPLYMFQTLISTTDKHP